MKVKNIRLKRQSGVTLSWLLSIKEIRASFSIFQWSFNSYEIMHLQNNFAEDKKESMSQFSSSSKSPKEKSTILFTVKY